MFAAGNEPMSRSNDRGFTLLELLIVVLILALALGVSFPLLSRGSAAIHLQATGRDILNTFRYAREKAVTEQIGMKVTAYREKQIFIVTDDLGDGHRAYAMPRDVKIHRLALAGNEVVEESLVFRFLPNGHSDDAEVVLKSDAGSFLRIISDPMSGGARIEQGQGNSTQ